MCELLGMSANTPTDIRFSFSGLIERGGRTGPHRDGWGITFHDGRGCRSFHDPEPGYRSQIARLIKDHAVRSRHVICHIRKATTGRVCLENTHPFIRELWGRSWSFAHNGRLPGVKRLPLGLYRPIGTTDSEHAFCWMMEAIRTAFPAPPRSPRPLWRLVADLAGRLNRLGPFNMMLCDARVLYCHCATDLSWITRQAPFGEAELIDAEVRADFARLAGETDVVTVIATRALTRNECWNRMAPGEFMVFRDGLIQARSKASQRNEMAVVPTATSG